MGQCHDEYGLDGYRPGQIASVPGAQCHDPAELPSFVPADVLLLDGRAVHVRSISPDDGDRLVSFHSSLSAESIYLRYFSAHAHLRDEEVRRFTHVDGDDRMAVVAVFAGSIVGVARYDRIGAAGEAEVAFVVADAFQGHGVATILLEHLASYARAHGITTFTADTLSQNSAMQAVFRRAGFTVSSTFADGVVRIRMAIEPSAAFQQAVDERDRQATANSIRRLLWPRSVAVIGAGRSRGGIGHEIVRNIVTGGFVGDLYPVNRSATSIAGCRAFASVLDVPGDIDVALVAVPSDGVLEVVRECADKGVGNVVLITAGFAEAGEDGRRLQNQVMELARHAGMRVVGPNCMGIINTSPGVSMNATFAPGRPLPGRVGFASQSGGLGIAVLQEASRRNLGLSDFVSVGNKADVSGNDLLQYWQQDPDTDVILLYLESFGNPRRFARIARGVSRTKPIIAVKSGRTRSGRRAASSHTAALASPDTAVDALFRQAGVIRVDTLEEMFDAAQVLTDQPRPAGRRVAIVGNAGGPGILAADACEAYGLLVPELGAPTQAALRGFLPAAAAVTNPVDMVASASASDYAQALELVLADDQIDAVLVVFVPPLVTSPNEVAGAVAGVASVAAKPVIANFVGMAAAPPELRTGSAGVPSFCFPEPAVRALARACDYGEWRLREPGHSVVFSDSTTGSARKLVQAVLDGTPEGRWLEPGEATEVVAAYGVPTPDTEVAGSAAGAVEAGERIGYPVALKAYGPALVHKTESGAVRLGLASGEQVSAAFEEMRSTLGEAMSGAVVQAMAPDGIETIVGLVNDPAFGPLIMFGSGGTAVELFADQAFRILPLTDRDAHDLVRSIKGSALLFGYRGRAPADVPALESLLLRVAQLADDIPEIAEMDLNPVICAPSGAMAVDVKIRVMPAPPRRDDTLRRLR